MAGKEREIDGADIAEQLQATTSADAGGNVSGTQADEDAALDIVFEPEAAGQRPN